MATVLETSPPVKGEVQFIINERNMFPTSKSKPVNGGVWWWRNESSVCQNMVLSSKMTEGEFVILIASVGQAHRGRL
jgi:hypothetical protein